MYSFSLIFELMSDKKVARRASRHLAVKTMFSKIKLIIRAYAPEFPYEKIAPINKALLVLGIGEMKFLGTPPVVVINEYVELAKEFGEEKSASFINGVLDNFRKRAGLKGSRKEEKSED